METPPLWPHQEFAIDESITVIPDVSRRVCLTSPTGAGKTLAVCMVIKHFVSQGWKAVMYTNRKMLVEQAINVFDSYGISHGVRASGHEDRREVAVQISSVPTERRRTVKDKKWQLHGLGHKCLAIVDEIHVNGGPTSQEIMKMHLDAGHAVLMVTATPLGIGDLADKLIVAGVNSELRACGALVPAMHYGPSEPELKDIGRIAVGEDLTETQNVKAIMTPMIFSRVLDSWQRLNPQQKPTLLFAPGVKESVWFAEQFKEAGVKAAHIDGAEVWIDGEFRPTSSDARKEVLDGLKDGSIKVVTNRFCLREGVDVPSVECGILATVIGSLQSYLQVAGRLLRASPSTGKTAATIIDCGGNWWRHGSVNIDRHWSLDQTSAMVSAMREDRLREKKEQEPVRCPKCSMILAGRKCPCGFEIDLDRKSRPVIQSDGTAKLYHGDIYKPRKISTAPDAQAKWEKMYYRAKNGGMSFRQAESFFAVENNWEYPSREFPFMPIEELDWFRLVKNVPKSKLRPKVK